MRANCEAAARPRARSFRKAKVARVRADIKDMYVDAGGREMVPFLEVLDGMVKRGIEVRLIHAKDPGPNCGAGTSPLES